MLWYLFQGAVVAVLISSGGASAQSKMPAAVEATRDGFMVCALQSWGHHLDQTKDESAAMEMAFAACSTEDQAMFRAAERWMGRKFAIEATHGFKAALKRQFTAPR